MKKLKSLALTFALAVGGTVGLATAANAQTVDVTQTRQQQQTELVSNNYIAPEVIDAVAQLPLLRENTYYRAGLGFIEARVEQTGERVGVEFELRNGYKTPLRAYNLDDGLGQLNFGNAKMNASALENRLAFNENQTRIYAQAYPNYIYTRPVAPIILIGPLFRGHNNHHYNDNHRWQQPRVILPPPIIIFRDNNHRDDHHGNRGGNRGGGRDDHRGGGGRDHRGPGGHRN